jgi:DNA-binding protein
MPVRPRARKNDVFVKRSRPKYIYVKRVVELLEDEDVREVVVHGMGAALGFAIEVALMVQEKLGGENAIQLSPKTDSIALVDEFEPLQRVRFHLPYLFLKSFFLQGLEPVSISRICSQISIGLKKI